MHLNESPDSATTVYSYESKTDLVPIPRALLLNSSFHIAKSLLHICSSTEPYPKQFLGLPLSLTLVCAYIVFVQINLPTRPIIHGTIYISSKNTLRPECEKAYISAKTCLDHHV